MLGARAVSHQGYGRIFQHPGKQCSCMALFALVHTGVEHPKKWSSDDLQYIIMLHGDRLYVW